MSKMMTALGGNAGAVLAGGGMCAALALGAYIGFGSTAPVEDAPVGPQPVAQTNVDLPEPANPLPEETAAVPTQSPTFDELRRERDGTTVIAGRAEPLSEVKILLDGKEIASTTADSTGGFAAITVLPPKEDAQVVSLSAQSGEETAASLDEIILAPQPRVVSEPTPAEPEIAQAEPEVAAGEPELAQAKPEPAAGEPAVAEPELAAAEPEPALAEPEPEQLAQADAIATENEETDVPDRKEAHLAETPTDPSKEQAQTAPAESVIADAEIAEQKPAEPAQVAVLKSDADGVSLLQAAEPEAMTSVALDTIGYSELGDVQLTGRAQAETAEVRVYLNNRSVISLPVGADGRWRGDLPDVDEGVYTLRVDEVSLAGAVSSRVETPFKRESQETLVAATAGQDGPVTSITVQTGATLWAIARERYGEGVLYVRVFEANADRIRNPDLIYPGQVFDLPN